MATAKEATRKDYPITQKDIDRFWEKVEINEPRECWPWLGPLCRHGYGRVRIAKHVTRPHRLAFHLTYPDVPLEGQVMRHLCHNPSCCNPDHLLPGTQRENMQDNRRGGKLNRRTAELANRLTMAQWRGIRIASVKHGVSKATVADLCNVPEGVIEYVLRAQKERPDSDLIKVSLSTTPAGDFAGGNEN